jgi:hypothetical protein
MPTSPQSPYHSVRRVSVSISASADASLQPLLPTRRKRFGGFQPKEIRRLKQHKAENTRLLPSVISRSRSGGKEPQKTG